ncbi:hypothetical protein LY76DRAFT_383840 [Colletotrichum caudatum]|nr:hypothetical protein LY76DRAFT_383840 [Colletotrichum caudatum]
MCGITASIALPHAPVVLNQHTSCPANGHVNDNTGSEKSSNGTTEVAGQHANGLALDTTKTVIVINVAMSSSDLDTSVASNTSVRSCIVVDLLPEDLAVACTADCTPEHCDNSTVS